MPEILRPEYQTAIDTAYSLLSEDLENREYDRAMVELIHYLYNVDIHRVCSDLNLQYEDL